MCIGGGSTPAPPPLPGMPETCSLQVGRSRPIGSGREECMACARSEAVDTGRL